MSDPGKCWWFAIDKETLRMVEVAEGTPGAFAFKQASTADDEAVRLLEDIKARLSKDYSPWRPYIARIDAYLAGRKK